MLLLAMLACDPIVPQTITGNLRVGPYLGEGPVTEGDIRIYDGGGVFFDESPINPDGSFEVTGPQSLPLLAVVSGPGLIEASFAGVLGVGPLQVPEGEIYGWSTELMERLRAEFGACGEAPGSVVTGEIRLFGATDSSGSVLIVDEGTAVLYDNDDQPIQACYLNDQGMYDPDAALTGATGRFGFFGLDAGTYRLLYGYDLGGEAVEAELFLTVREEGITPLYPVFIDVPQ